MYFMYHVCVSRGYICMYMSVSIYVCILYITFVYHLSRMIVIHTCVYVYRPLYVAVAPAVRVSFAYLHTYTHEYAYHYIS
jgi:hypothetical protein